MDRPNFVLIMTDTQGANVVGCYGDGNVNTPCIDRLAGEGVRFEQAYTTCPVCTPARGGIFSGMYPHINGAWANDLSMGQSILNMGQRMERLGYHTAFTGKWHLDGHDYFGNGKCPPGWDPEYWYDGLCYLNELSDEQKTQWRTGLRSYEDLVAHGITREFTWANHCTRRAEQFLKQRDPDHPFLLVVSYDEPHGPCVCPPQHVAAMKDYRLDIGDSAFDTLENKPAHQQEWSKKYLETHERSRTVAKPMYFGCNNYVDSEIGAVIDAVKQYAGDNTYIIYTSDHGDMFGAHGISSKGPAMYDEITRIPLIISGPDQSVAGKVDRTPASHVDILPTVLELAGASIPDIMDGRSLKPRIAQPTETDRGDSVFIEFNRFSADDDNCGSFQPIRAMVKGGYKLVINLLYTDELYHLSEDPAELNNLIEHAETAEIRDAMHCELMRWMRARRDPFCGEMFAKRGYHTLDYPWDGGYIYRPDDGVEVGFRDYMTAMVTNKKARRDEA